MKSFTKFTIVAPIYNEKDNIAELVRQVKDTFSTYDITMICVNDGSSDNSYELLKEQEKENSWIKVLNLSRNFGQQSAIIAGLSHAVGDFAVVIDSDLQDGLDDVHTMIKKWKEGYEIVYAVKKKPFESKGKLFLRAIFYEILDSLTKGGIPRDAGAFSLIDIRAVKILCRFPERNIFFPGLRSWIGFKQCPIDVIQKERHAGDPTVSITKHFKLAFDAIFSHSYIPLRLILIVGVIAVIFSFGFGLFLLAQKIFTNYAAPGFTTIALLSCFFSGAMLVSLGIIGEYILRIYDEVKSRPKYILTDMDG